MINLRGRRFGRLVVILPTPEKIGRRIIWWAKCDCGEYIIAHAGNILSGHTRSCGCLQRDTISLRIKQHPIKPYTTHGHTIGKHQTREYTTWINMKARCYDPTSESYQYYGARGISVCNRWKNSFENFIFDMGVKPFGLTLDRKNSDGNYEPDNCRWATYQQQNRNRRRWRK
jgi:hypothetical protein